MHRQAPHHSQLAKVNRTVAADLGPVAILQALPLALPVRRNQSPLSHLFYFILPTRFEQHF
jgi:hypothetical protein